MPSILTSGIEVLLDHLQRVLELDQSTHRQILALDGDDHLVRRGQRVDRQQPEAGRRVDADEVVVAGDFFQRLLQRALAADLGAHRDLGPGQVDRGDGDVDLALDDDLADRHVVDQHVVEAFLHLVRIDPLAHSQVPLRIEVDAEHLVTGLGEGNGKIQGSSGLGHPTLLIGKGNDISVLNRRLSLNPLNHNLMPGGRHRSRGINRSGSSAQRPQATSTNLRYGYPATGPGLGASSAGGVDGGRRSAAREDDASSSTTGPAGRSLIVLPLRNNFLHPAATPRRSDAARRRRRAWTCSCG